MPPTRKYAKGAEHQDAVYEAALAIIAERGYDAPTIRELAATVGLSKTAVAHHIGSKDELLLELIRRRDMPPGEDFEDRTADELLTRTIERLREHRHVSGLRELYVRLSAEATAEGHVAHEFFRDRYDQLERVGVRMFTELEEQGRLRHGVEPRSLTILLMAIIDGLELQSFYRADLDLPRTVQAFIEMTIDGPSSAVVASRTDHPVAD